MLQAHVLVENRAVQLVVNWMVVVDNVDLTAAVVAMLDRHATYSLVVDNTSVVPTSDHTCVAVVAETIVAVDMRSTDGLLLMDNSLFVSIVDEGH